MNDQFVCEAQFFKAISIWKCSLSSKYYLKTCTRFAPFSINRWKLGCFCKVFVFITTKNANALRIFFNYLQLILKDDKSRMITPNVILHYFTNRWRRACAHFGFRNDKHQIFKQTLFNVFKKSVLFFVFFFAFRHSFLNVF